LVWGGGWRGWVGLGCGGGGGGGGGWGGGVVVRGVVVAGNRMLVAGRYVERPQVNVGGPATGRERVT